MVRRSAASNLGKFAATVEPSYLKSEILSFFRDLTQDGTFCSHESAFWMKLEYSNPKFYHTTATLLFYVLQILMTCSSGFCKDSCCRGVCCIRQAFGTTGLCCKHSTCYNQFFSGLCVYFVNRIFNLVRHWFFGMFMGWMFPYAWLYQDKSWRVRYMVANQLYDLCEAVGPESTMLVSLFNQCSFNERLAQSF